MGWREVVNQATGPGISLGITTGDWLSLLADNGFRIPPRYWPRTAFTTLISLVNTAWWATAEAMVYRSTARQTVQPPLFILGHWRSGTTHLHNLLSLDERFAYPRFDQVMIPNTFLTGQRVMWAASVLLPNLHFAGPGTLVVAGLLLGLANAVLRPVLVILTLPLTLVTLGLFLLVINAAMVWLVAWVLPGMVVHGFLTAVLTAVTVSVVSFVGHALLRS